MVSATSPFSIIIDCPPDFVDHNGFFYKSKVNTLLKKTPVSLQLNESWPAHPCLDMLLDRSYVCYDCALGIFENRFVTLFDGSSGLIPFPKLVSFSADNSSKIYIPNNNRNNADDLVHIKGGIEELIAIWNSDQEFTVCYMGFSVNTDDSSLMIDPSADPFMTNSMLKPPKLVQASPSQSCSMINQSADRFLYYKDVTPSGYQGLLRCSLDRIEHTNLWKNSLKLAGSNEQFVLLSKTDLSIVCPYGPDNGSNHVYFVSKEPSSLIYCPFVNGKPLVNILQAHTQDANSLFQDPKATQVTTNVLERMNCFLVSWKMHSQYNDKFVIDVTLVGSENYISEIIENRNSSLSWTPVIGSLESQFVLDLAPYVRIPARITTNLKDFTNSLALMHQGKTCLTTIQNMAEQAVVVYTRTTHSKTESITPKHMIDNEIINQVLQVAMVDSLCNTTVNPRKFIKYAKYHKRDFSFLEPNVSADIVFRQTSYPSNPVLELVDQNNIACPTYHCPCITDKEQTNHNELQANAKIEDSLVTISVKWGNHHVYDLIICKNSESDNTILFAKLEVTNNVIVAMVLMTQPTSSLTIQIDHRTIASGRWSPDIFHSRIPGSGGIGLHSCLLVYHISKYGEILAYTLVSGLPGYPERFYMAKTIDVCSDCFVWMCLSSQLSAHTLCSLHDRNGVKINDVIGYVYADMQRSTFMLGIPVSMISPIVVDRQRLHPLIRIHTIFDYTSLTWVVSEHDLIYDTWNHYHTALAVIIQSSDGSPNTILADVLDDGLNLFAASKTHIYSVSISLGEQTIENIQSITLECNTQENGHSYNSSSFSFNQIPSLLSFEHTHMSIIVSWSAVTRYIQWAHLLLADSNVSPSIQILDMEHKYGQVKVSLATRVLVMNSTSKECACVNSSDYVVFITSGKVYNYIPNIPKPKSSYLTIENYDLVTHQDMFGLSMIWSVSVSSLHNSHQLFSLPSVLSVSWESNGCTLSGSGLVGFMNVVVNDYAGQNVLQVTSQRPMYVPHGVLGDVVTCLLTMSQERIKFQINNNEHEQECPWKHIPDDTWHISVPIISHSGVRALWLYNHCLSGVESSRAFQKMCAHTNTFVARFPVVFGMLSDFSDLPVAIANPDFYKEYRGPEYPVHECQSKIPDAFTLIYVAALLPYHQDDVGLVTGTSDFLEVVLTDAENGDTNRLRLSHDIVNPLRLTASIVTSSGITHTKTSELGVLDGRMHMYAITYDQGTIDLNINVFHPLELTSKKARIWEIETRASLLQFNSQGGDYQQVQCMGNYKVDISVKSSDLGTVLPEYVSLYDTIFEDEAIMTYTQPEFQGDPLFDVDAFLPVTYEEWKGSKVINVRPINSDVLHFELVKNSQNGSPFVIIEQETEGFSLTTVSGILHVTNGNDGIGGLSLFASGLNLQDQEFVFITKKATITGTNMTINIDRRSEYTTITPLGTVITSSSLTVAGNRIVLNSSGSNVSWPRQFRWRNRGLMGSLMNVYSVVRSPNPWLDGIYYSTLPVKSIIFTRGAFASAPFLMQADGPIVNMGITIGIEFCPTRTALTTGCVITRFTFGDSVVEIGLTCRGNLFMKWCDEVSIMYTETHKQQPLQTPKRPFYRLYIEHPAPIAELISKSSNGFITAIVVVSYPGSGDGVLPQTVLNNVSAHIDLYIDGIHRGPRTSDNSRCIASFLITLNRNLLPQGSILLGINAQGGSITQAFVGDIPQMDESKWNIFGRSLLDGESSKNEEMLRIQRVGVDTMRCHEHAIRIYKITLVVSFSITVLTRDKPIIDDRNDTVVMIRRVVCYNYAKDRSANLFDHVFEQQQEQIAFLGEGHNEKNKNMLLLVAGDQTSILILNWSRMFVCGNSLSSQNAISNRFTEIAKYGSLVGRDVVYAYVDMFRTTYLDTDGNIHVFGTEPYLLMSGQNVVNEEPVNIRDYSENVANEGSLRGRAVMSLSMAGGHVLALDSFGHLHAWGPNSLMQTGIPSPEVIISTPRCITREVEAFHSLEFSAVVSAQGSHSVGLTREGAVYTWGANGGLSGDGSVRSGSVNPVKASNYGSLQLLSIKNARVVKIAAGRTFNIAMDTQGHIHAWGVPSSAMPLLGPEPKDMTDLGVFSRNAVDVDANGFVMGIIDVNGEVQMWGYEVHGQLGNGLGTHDKTKAVQTSLYGSLAGRYAEKLYIGKTNVFCTDTSGHIHVWGRDEFGKCGTGDANTDRLIDVPVDISSDVLT